MTKKRKIMAQILAAINCGAIPVGARLPSIRETARINNVSVYTVVSAYDELVSLNVIESRTKSGYYVTGALLDLDALLLDCTKVTPDEIKQNFFIDPVSAQFSRNLARSVNSLQLSNDEIGPSYFENMISKYDAMLSRITHPVDVGENELIRLVVHWMSHSGCSLVRGNIVFAHNAPDLLIRIINSCRKPGYMLAIEAPGSRFFRYSARMTGSTYCEIASDPVLGLDIDDFERRIEEGIKFFALFVQPNCGDPYGAVMPLGSRKRLVRLCAKHSIPIIEYDPFGFLSLSSTEQKPIKSIDHRNVIYVSDMRNLCGIPMCFCEAGCFSLEVALMGIFGKQSNIPAKHLQRALSFFGQTKPEQWTLPEEIRTGAHLFYSEFIQNIPDSITVVWQNQAPYIAFILPEWSDAKSFFNYASNNGVFLAPGSLFSSSAREEHCYRINACCHRDPAVTRHNARGLAKLLCDFLNQY